MDLKIDVLCAPCIKCTTTLKNVQKALSILGLQASVTHVQNFKEFSAYSANVSQTPVVIINGSVEFVGQAPYDLLYNKLAEVTHKKKFVPPTKRTPSGEQPYEIK